MKIITADQVKKLRDKTGAGMMDCKKALQNSGGDFQKAIDYLRQQGIAKATQKVSRITKEGMIYSTIGPQNKVGVLVEINCETDFVARTNDFKMLAKQVADWIIQHKPADIGEVAESLKETLNQSIAKLGENITTKRFALFRMDEGSKGVIYSYIHPGNKLGVLLKLKCQTDPVAQSEEFKQLAKDISMQIAATNPLALSRDKLSSEIIDKEKEIYRTQAKNEGKPEKIIERIVQGKLEKYFQEVCLLEQPFVKDQDRSVSNRIAQTEKELGEPITVAQFVRFRLGDETS